MSHHHPDPVEENIETHPVKMTIAIGIGTIGLVVGIIMLATFAVNTHSVGGETKANTPEAISARIAPLTQLVADPTKGPVPPLSATPAAPVAAEAPIVAAAIPAATAPDSAPSVAANGKSIYDTTCAVCHANGVAGAPKTGDKAGWTARIAKGNTTLYEHALKGINAMPAKGGNPGLAEADVKKAVDYMVSLVK